MVGPYQVIQDPGGNYTAAIPNDGLSDYSDATFVDVEQYIGPSGVVLNRVDGTLGVGVGDEGTVTTAYARFQATGPVAGVRIFTAGAGTSSDMDPSQSPVESSLGTLYPMDSGALRQIEAARNGFTVTMRVSVPANRTDPSAITRIYEAWIVVAVVYPGDAPPCRLFPRGDGLGVGSGRHFPPSKSQQRSGRRFGYY